MEIQNNLENKAAFFAQYWGQKILIRNANNQQYNDVIALTAYNYDGWLDKSVLELKSIEDITDNDMNFIHSVYEYFTDYEGIIEWVINGFDTSLHRRKQLTQNEYLIIIDYLRSKGYAIPWMGLSIEKLVEYGWVKLKNKES